MVQMVCHSLLHNVVHVLMCKGITSLSLHFNHRLTKGGLPVSARRWSSRPKRRCAIISRPPQATIDVIVKIYFSRKVCVFKPAASMPSAMIISRSTCVRACVSPIVNTASTRIGERLSSAEFGDLSTAAVPAVERQSEAMEP